MYKICVFFLKKQLGFCEKKLKIYKISKADKFAVEILSNVFISLKLLSHFNCEMFWRRIKKLLSLGKLEKNNEEYFLKKRFHPFERYHYRKWETEKMPVVACRLVELYNSHHMV